MSAPAQAPAQDMGSLLEQYDDQQSARLQRGDYVEGTVVLVDRDEVLVDIGGKMEAIVPTGELGENPLQRGDHVGAVVIASENAEGRPVISINKAKAEQGWRDLQAKFDSGETIEGEVVDQNKGGIIVSVNGVRGFVPLSQIVDLRRGGADEQVEEKLRSMRGMQLFLKIIEMNRRRNRLILSERAASKERRAALKDRLLEELQPGEVRKGRVSSLTDFGAFVDLGGADGLIHLSELSWGQVQHPSQILRVGQEIDVRVVGVDRENKKIALSLKQVEENPWNRVEQKYTVGTVVMARITKLAQFGAFAEIEPGVEGLIHISELSDERITHPKQVVREGEEVQLKVIRIDPQRHRLGLSLRQADEGLYAEGAGLDEDWGSGSYGPYGDEDTSIAQHADAEPDVRRVPELVSEAPPEAPREVEAGEPSATERPGLPAKPEDQPDPRSEPSTDASKSPTNGAATTASE